MDACSKPLASLFCCWGPILSLMQPAIIGCLTKRCIRGTNINRRSIGDIIQRHNKLKYDSLPIKKQSLAPATLKRVRVNHKPLVFRELSTALKTPAKPATRTMKIVARSNEALLLTTLGGMTSHGMLGGMDGVYAGLTAVGLWIIAEPISNALHVGFDSLRSKEIRETFEGRLGQAFANAVEKVERHHLNPVATSGLDYERMSYDTQKAALPLLMTFALLSWSNPSIFGFLGDFKASALTAASFLTMSPNWVLGIHRQAHLRDDTKHPLAKFLQKHNLLLSSQQHGLHHYRETTGQHSLWNGWSNRFFREKKYKLSPKGPKTNTIRKIEALVFRVTGIEPPLWDEYPELKDEALGRSAL